MLFKNISTGIQRLCKFDVFITTKHYNRTRYQVPFTTNAYATFEYSSRSKKFLESIWKMAQPHQSGNT